MTVKTIRQWLFPLTLTLLLVCTTLLTSCMSLSGDMDESAPAMTLSSGVDKKSAKVDFGAESRGGHAIVTNDVTKGTGGSLFEGEVQSAPGWSQPHMAPQDGSSAPAPPATPDADPAPDGTRNNVISRALASAGINEEKINGWVFPKAYAADHGADEQYLVRSGDVHLEVDNYEDAQQSISSIAGSYGGYVSNSNSQRLSDDTVEGWIMVRVPADKFFDAWEDIRKTGDINTEKITTDDVSQQFLSNHSKIKNLLAQQATLQEMLDEAVQIQRKHGLSEGRSLLLDVQERLFDVTSQLQAVEDRQNALSDSITKSTITAHLKEIRVAAEVVEQVKEDWNWGTDETFGDAYNAALNRLKLIWNNIIWFVFTAWTWIIPLLFWVAVGVFAYRKWLRPQLVKAAEQAKLEKKPQAEKSVKEKLDDKFGNKDQPE